MDRWLSPLSRDRAVSLELRFAISTWQTRLPEDLRYVVHYFEHWLETGAGSRQRSLAKLAAAVGQGLPRRPVTAGEVAVFSGKNWRGSLSRPEHHYAYFGDVVEGVRGVHVELPWDRPTSATGADWLASHGWSVQSLHDTIQPGDIVSSQTSAAVIGREVRQAVTRAGVWPWLEASVHHFSRFPLRYALLLEHSLRKLEFDRIYLTGESSTFGRALLSALPDHPDVHARQHGVVLPTQLEFLHTAETARYIPRPRTMLVYEDYYARQLSWMQQLGTSVHTWADPRLQPPGGWTRRPPRYVLWAAQPLSPELTARAASAATAVAEELRLPLRVRLHPRMRSSDVTPYLPHGGAVLANGSLLEQLSSAARLVTVFSTLAYEAMAVGVPVTLLAMGSSSAREAFPPSELIETRPA